MKKKGYYQQLLVSYLPIVFCVFTILVLVTLAGSAYLSQESLKKESLVMAKFVNSAIDREVRLSEQVMFNELLDKSQFAQLAQLSPARASYYKTYELSVMLRKVALKHPMIHSMYVYRFSDRSVQSMNATTTLDQYGDRDFIEKAVRLTEADRTAWNGVRDYREFDAQPPVRVVTLARSIPISREAGGLLVMNVGVNALTELVARLTDPDSTYVEVTDAEGREILRSGPKRVKATAVDTSSFTGYTIRLGYSEGILNGILNTAAILYAAAGFIVVCLGLLWTVYTTRRNYKPVHAIVSKVDRLVTSVKLPFEKKPHHDEFGFLEQVLERMIEQSTTFEQQHMEHTLIKRRILFAELREGGFSGTAEEARQQLALHDWDPNLEGFLLAVVEMDDYPAFSAKFGERELSALKFAMYNALVEMDHAAMRPQPWADWVSADQVAMMYPVRRDDPAQQETIVAALRQALIWIDHHLNIKISIGLGSPVWDTKQISVSYGEARQLLKYKLSLGKNRLIGNWDLEGTVRSGHLGMIVSSRDLAVQYRLAVPDWRERLDDWLDQAKKQLAPKEDIDMLLQGLVYHIRREVSQMSDEMQVVWNAEFDPELERAMKEQASAEEMGGGIREILVAAGIRMEAIRKRNGHAEAMSKIREYIDRHYADPNLSLSSLSSEFDMNSKTLSRLFKEQFGENFVDYLMKSRINQAKRMLLETETPIQQISQEVGYLNALSFTRAFKKMEGITPFELRKAGGLERKAT
ncbi:helix-turn-helix domain-containing protein [Cohnella hongkongensis]|uniref:Helix-turn-helix domain-containing protein n=1 Tax=Cohnella hongkongensis TaxID=178337 RepID=A0ABV9F641_9BACL